MNICTHGDWFGFPTSRPLALQWADGSLDDVTLTDLSLEQTLPEYRDCCFWIGSVLSREGMRNVWKVIQQEGFTRVAFRTENPALIRWADEQGLKCVYSELDGKRRYYGALKA